ncbi:MAG: hypothetical protein GX851_02180, partial [Clostridiales bacterium]|nr:hypothetical protein [Clostridiales bacterium]
MKKRFLSLLLTACMVLSIIPLSYVTVNADIAASPTLGNYYEGTWLGNDAAGNTLYDLSWYDTENANTYEISTAAGLAGLSYLIDTHKDEFVGKTVILASDIDLGAYNWMPIDIWNDSRDEMDGLPGFRGLLDGNGKTISNLRIKSGFNGEIGLFGRLAGYVKDLTISGATIDIPTANASVAFFVGCLSNDTPSITATVENCKAVNSSINCAKSLTVDYIVGRTRLGGVVTGCSQEGCTINISNVTDWNSPYNSDFCDNYNSKTEFVINNELDLATIAYLSGKGKTFDGKTVAMNANLDMSRFDWVPLKVFSGTFSGNNKTITGLHTEAEITAAFIEEGVFCTVNNLTLEVDFHITNGGSVYAAVGGVIALARGSRIANCRVYGSVSSAPGDNAHAGGIVGQTSGWTVTIQNCVNYANVSGSYSGGICGHHASSKDATGLYMNCINLGNVTGISAPGVEAYAGGIVGRQTDSVRYDYCASMPEAVISAASDKGAAYIGGIVGAIYASGEVSTLTITNSFCTSELVGTGNSAYISGIFGYNKAYATIEQAYVEDCYFGGIINHNGSSINPDSSK